MSDTPHIAGEPAVVQYGKRSWSVRTVIGENVFVQADDMRGDSNGALVFTRDNDPKPILVFAPGRWHTAYLTDMPDHGAVCVTHWDYPPNAIPAPTAAPAPKPKAKKRLR
jgi:hypothetical protein